MESIDEKLYDNSETVPVRFIGFVVQGQRYDLGFVHTNLFFNHPLIICMQTGKSALLSMEQAVDTETVQKVFGLDSKRSAEVISSFLGDQLPETSIVAEVEKQ